MTLEPLAITHQIVFVGTKEPNVDGCVSTVLKSPT
jgi:hypothetical protein